MTIKLNKFYKNKGGTRAMPEYLIPVNLYEELPGEDYTMYKDHSEDRLYNVWDIENGEMLVYSNNMFLRYMELMRDDEDTA